MQVPLQKLTHLASLVVRGDTAKLTPPAEHQSELTTDWLRPFLWVALGITAEPNPNSEWDGVWQSRFDRDQHYCRVLATEGVVLILLLDRHTHELINAHWPVTKHELTKLIVGVALEEPIPV